MVFCVAPNLSARCGWRGTTDSKYRLRMHRTIEPTVLYFGTPVALISTLNADGSPNLAPMSSAWWLGWSCMLGLGQMGQTSDNLIRTRECVINLPSEDLVSYVDRLALTTGKSPCRKRNVSGAIAMSRTNSASPGSLRSGRNWSPHRGCASVRYKWRVSSRISALSARM